MRPILQSLVRNASRQASPKHEEVTGWSKQSSPIARNMVRHVLSQSTHPVGMTSAQIFEKIHEQFADVEKVPAPPPFKLQPGMKGRFGRPPIAVPEPPHREHPIRSIRFLKRVILADMERESEIGKIVVSRQSLPPEDDKYLSPRVPQRIVRQNPTTTFWKLDTLVMAKSLQANLAAAKPET
ncbi:hypothetical protein EIP91_005277 [Steccherinum ochraceum]|uniref:Uncharacterized protein n=1 Tax=Steccherinum ochraceum TaxID=92696 RepID=A0A4R0RU35_9APHY|nr:hypothetical protein EIP91_005277 [Steccherinum ochraceum]